MILYNIFIIITAVYTASYAAYVFKRHSKVGGVMAWFVTLSMLGLSVVFQVLK